MTRFQYDGSFAGFLCAASLALEKGGVVARRGDDSPDLFSTVVEVVTDDVRASAMESRITAAAGREEIRSLLMVHAADDPEVPVLLLRYVALTLEARAPVLGNLADPVVLRTVRIRDRVAHEINRFMGFVRFRRSARGLYYAPIEPDADIVGFLGPHFMDRFPDQTFLVHDVARDIGFWHEVTPGSGCPRHGLVDLSSLPEELRAALAVDADPALEDMWRNYFRDIAIKERKNPRLQARFLPHRYRKHLVETEDAGRQAVTVRHRRTQELRSTIV